MWQYDDLLKEILEDGEHKMDRTGTGCTSLFGPQLWFDLENDCYPAVWGKKLQWSSVVKELLWFIRGETNINTLGCKIWDEWADEAGNCGPIYGHQWRAWPAFFHDKDPRDPDKKVIRRGGIDQLSELVHNLLFNPGSRRHIVSAWNVSQLDFMALAPCHCMFQFHVGHENDEPKWLDLKMYQRSADAFLGVPFNIASYSLLLLCVAQLVDLKPRYYIHSFGDVHIYDNHHEAVAQYHKQVQQYALQQVDKEPRVELPEFTTLEELEQCDHSDFKLLDYVHGPSIPAPVAV